MEFDAFMHPAVLWCNALLIPIIVWYIVTHRTQSATFFVSSDSFFTQNRATLATYLMHAPFLFRIVAFVFIIIALARPVTYDSYSDSTTYGIDIMLAVDISTSMLAQDLKPDRIEASKEVAAKFISNRQFDRIGVVIFSGESYTLSPLTTDHATILNALQDIRPGSIEDGTAIGTGLGLCVARLKESTAKSKVIILLTDGVNNAGDIDPLTAAELAKKYNIKVYTIGVGVRGDAPYPVQTAWGTQYHMLPADIDEAMLKKISNITEANYFRATNKKELREIYDHIDSLEKTEIMENKFTTKDDKFQPFVLLALLSLAVEFICRYVCTKKYI